MSRDYATLTVASPDWEIGLGEHPPALFPLLRPSLEKMTQLRVEKRVGELFRLNLFCHKSYLVSKSPVF